MSNERALATVSGGDWQTMIDQASVLVKSGFLPSHIKTPEQAVAVMLTGRELGIPTMTALRSIAVIQGKPTLAAELMAALIERDYGPLGLRVEETNDGGCTVSYWKPGWPDRKSYEFTIEQAKQAGLTGDNWRKYPAAMLRARCISAVAKMAFQATLGGLYTAEEMGAPVIVTEDGEVVYAPESVVTAIETNYRELPPQTPKNEPEKPLPLADDAPLAQPDVLMLFAQCRKLRVPVMVFNTWAEDKYHKGPEQLTKGEGRAAWAWIQSEAAGIKSAQTAQLRATADAADISFEIEGAVKA